MSGDAHSRWKLRCVIVVALSAVLLSPCVPAAGSNEQYHPVTVVSVRTIRNSFPIARWSGVHEFVLHFSVQDSDKLNCYEFRSVILEDVNDLRRSSGHQIQLLQHGNKVTALLEDGRNIKAERTKPDQCSL